MEHSMCIYCSQLHQSSSSIYTISEMTYNVTSGLVEC